MTLIKQQNEFEKQKLHQCRFCRYETWQKSHMRKHIKHCRHRVGKHKHLKSKTGYACQICDVGFQCKSAIKKHFFQRHDDAELEQFYGSTV